MLTVIVVWIVIVRKLRAKELFIIIADEKFAFTNSIEDKDDGSGYSIVKKFLRNDKFNILKI